MSIEEISEETEIKNESVAFPVQARNIAGLICDDKSLQKANDFLVGVKRMRKKIFDFFKPLKQKADEAKKAILDREKESDDPLKQAEVIVNNQMSVYLTKKRAEAKAEEDRKRAEALKQAEAAKQKQALANPKQAEKILSKPVVLAKAKEEVFTPKGTHIRENWYCEVEDLNDLIQDVIDGKASRDCLKADQSFLNTLVKKQKDKMKISGVRTWCENKSVSRVS